MDNNSTLQVNDADVRATENPNDERKKRKLMRSPSNVWEHFTKYVGGNRCKCNYCEKDYSCESGFGTKNMLNHLKLRCQKYKNFVAGEDKKQKGLVNAKISNICAPGSLVPVGFSKEEWRKTCARMVILDEMCFSSVEKEGFRYFYSVACPKFTPPSRRTIARDIYQLYLDEKLNLKRLFIENTQRVCITTDCWTSIQNINYIVITYHFIDYEWKLHKRILSFSTIPNHKGETIGKLIESCLLE